MRANRWSSRRLASVLLAVGVVVSLGVGTPRAFADPKHDPPRGPGSDLLGEGHGPRDKDNRVGTVAPNGRQRALAAPVGTVPWNAFGTPAPLSPARGSR